MMNKRARKKRAKRIVKAVSFALAMGVFTVAIYATQLKQVNINYAGKDISFKTFAGNVSDAFKEKNINVDENYEMSTDMYGKLYKNNTISINQKPVILAMVDPVTEEVVEEIPVIIEPVAEKKVEESRKVEEPIDDTDRSTAVKKAQDTTSRGTVRTNWAPDVFQKEEGVLETANGDLIEYEGYLELEATAYCSCYECCGKHPGNKWYGITATGTRAKVGTIAVDPRVISLGTKVYVEGLYGANNYGYAVAEDTGGAIKGNIIDLYFNTHAETVVWGRQQVRVYILKDASKAKKEEPVVEEVKPEPEPEVVEEEVVEEIKEIE